MARARRRSAATSSMVGMVRAAQGISDEKLQQAWRARSAMQGMLPSLTEFANSVSASLGGPTDLVVKIGSRPMTDGHTVYCPPSMELGLIVQHDRRVCSIRGADDNMLCPACHRIDVVSSHFLHEIAHVIANSFEKCYDRSKVAALKRALRNAGTGKRADELRKRVEQVAEQTNDYWAIARSVSPFLNGILNCLEDARVNQRMYEARPGTRKMFHGKALRIARDGIEQDSGETVHWNELPLNSQMKIGILLSAFDYRDLLEVLDERIQEAMSDPELTRLVSKAARAPGVKDIYELSFDVLERSRQLGYFLDENDPEDEQEQEMEASLNNPNQEEGESEQSESSSESESAPEPQDDGDGEPGGDAGENGEESEGDSEPAEGDDADASDDSEQDGDDASESKSSTQEEGDAESEESEPQESEGSEPQESEDDGTPSEGAVKSGSEDDIEGDEGEGGESEPESGTEDVDRECGTGEMGEHSNQQDIDQHGDYDFDEGEELDDLDDDDLEMGTAEEAEEAMQLFGEHDEDGEVMEENDPDDEDAAAMELAVLQGEHFDEPSPHLIGFHVHQHGKPNRPGKEDCWDPYSSYSLHPDEVKPPEGIVNQSIMRLRRIFAENKRAKRSPHRSGRVNASRLASVRTGNKEVFTRASLPGKRDYSVVLALDISGSTRGSGIRTIKEIGFATAELMNRLGVDFCVYAHEGNPVGSWPTQAFEQDVWEVKTWNQPWDNLAKERLSGLVPGYNNLDGHAMEFFRKVLDQQTTTDRIILYFTDGTMPEANKYEEAKILRRELLTCQRRGYTVIGVGIGTDSPKQHGLDTVVVRGHSDVPKVVSKLEEYLR